MPSRHRIKQYGADMYYHVYNRGVAKGLIFKQPEDYAVFLNLLKRYLSNEPVKDKQGRDYPWLHDDVQLLAFCLMPNHFHLLLFQSEPTAMTRLLRGVATAYTMYFNKKYKRVGPLFQERYKASHIISDAYLEHISRYIHLNPEQYERWEYSSLPYYLGKKSAEWVAPGVIMDIFDNVGEYERFLKDYEGNRETLKAISSQLADN